MKRFTFIFLILLFALNIQAQNFSRLEELADQLKNQTDKLIELTSKKIKKRSENSRDDLEQAFLAEQMYVSAKLIENLIDRKRSAEELRMSGKILSNMTRRTARFRSNQSEWQSVTETISNLNNEFRLYEGNKKDDDDEIEEDENRLIVGRVFWRGKVDNEVQLVIRDLNLQVKTISGQSYPPGTFSFTSRLQKDNSLRVDVKKDEGRGNARVIQQPNIQNNYTTIIQILDTDKGARDYALEIFWYKQ